MPFAEENDRHSPENQEAAKTVGQLELGFMRKKSQANTATKNG